MDSRSLCLAKEVWVSQDLVVARIESDSDEEVLAGLSGILYEQGAVEESFAEAVAARERRYPTGLQFAEMGVALPHTDAVHVNHQAVAIGILERPVQFCAMGMPGTQIEVSLVFMLAVAEPEKEAPFLASLIELFQDAGNLRRLHSASTPEEAAREFRHMFTQRA